MKRLNKALVVTAGAAAMALSASPATAATIGASTGVSVIAATSVSAISYRGGYDGDRYDRRDNRRHANRARGGQRQAVNRCTKVAERQLTNRWGRANVTQVRDVQRTRNGYRVDGRIEVSNRGRYKDRNYDRGRFTCYDDGYGRPQVSYRGIR